MRHAAALLAVLLLTACSNGGPGGDGGEVRGADAALEGLDAPWPSADDNGRVDRELSRGDIPVARRGRWEEVTVQDGRTTTETVCEDGEVPDLSGDPSCPYVITRQIDDGYTADWRCELPRGRVRSHSIITGDLEDGRFRNRFSMVVASRVRPDSGDPVITVTRLDARRTGNCD